jgi:hypothetical protein
MIGTKKMHNAQFYVEGGDLPWGAWSLFLNWVMEVVQSLGGNRRSMIDPDEIEEEQ